MGLGGGHAEDMFDEKLPTNTNTNMNQLSSSSFPAPISAFGAHPTASASHHRQAASHGFSSSLAGLSLTGMNGYNAPLPAGPPIHIPRAPLRSLVRSCWSRGHIASAVFYADKYATLERYSAESSFLLADAYLHARQFKRALHVLKKRGLLALPDGRSVDRAVREQERAIKQRQQQQPSNNDVQSQSNEDDDLSDPLTLRLRSLYLGLQCLLEMQEHDEALSCCLPAPSLSTMQTYEDDGTEDGQDQDEHNAIVGHGASNFGGIGAGLEAVERGAAWRRRVDAILLATDPATLDLAMMQGTGHNNNDDGNERFPEGNAERVREILGNEEVELVTLLVKYHSIQRSKSRMKRGQTTQTTQQQQQQQPQSSSSTGSVANATSTSALLLTPSIPSSSSNTPSIAEEQWDQEIDGPIQLCSSLAFLRGHLYELLQHRYHALFWYRLSLEMDVRNFEAFDRLTSGRLLHARGEARLVRDLSNGGGVFNKAKELEWIQLIWANRVDTMAIDPGQEERGTTMESAGGGMRGDGRPAPVIPPKQSIVPTTPAPTTTATAPSSSGDAVSASSPMDDRSSLLYRYRLLTTKYGFATNHDLLAAIVQYKYNHGQYRECYELSKRIIDGDPFMLSILPSYLCTLVELRMKAELFYCAHQLVEAYPDKAIAWFAVACYYFLLGKLDVARRFFHKSTRLDSLFPGGWIGFGHTFSLSDESDQALVAYRTASRLFAGSHVPLLCIGMEYLKTNHWTLAKQFLQHAASTNEHDPLPHNELAVLFYRNRQYDLCVEACLRCLARVKVEVLANWEPTLFNLGHAYRKLRRYPEAISAYNRALSVCSHNKSSILSALAFTYHLQGMLSKAIDYYHQALGMNPRDTFASDMLDRALKETFEEDEGSILANI